MLAPVPFLLFSATQSFATEPASGFHRDSVRVTATHFREMFAHSYSFRDLVFRFEEILFVRAQQAAARNTLHHVRSRMCRWLLEAHDKNGSTTIPVTRELLARLLGVQRTTITFVAKSLQRAGMISVRRGHVELFDLQQLRDAACECYAAFGRIARRSLKNTRHRPSVRLRAC
jgi:hypothetical protein